MLNAKEYRMQEWENMIFGNSQETGEIMYQNHRAVAFREMTVMEVEAFIMEQKNKWDKEYSFLHERPVGATSLTKWLPAFWKSRRGRKCEYIHVSCPMAYAELLAEDLKQLECRWKKGRKIECAKDLGLKNTCSLGDFYKGNISGGSIAIIINRDYTVEEPHFFGMGGSYRRAAEKNRGIPFIHYDKFEPSDRSVEKL